jgi:hypothetical protein
VWQTLLQHDVLVGATLVAIYQIAKFTELNLADPITRRYIALLPGVTVRDFAGAYAYYGALVSFIGVSLLIYFALCQLSPEVLRGAAKILINGDPPASLDSIPYPLYIAALFIGLTQPVIPILSQFGDAQRKFFHDRIDVPRRVIDLSEALTDAIELRAGADKRRLSCEVRKLASGGFVASLRNHGDGAFYRMQLEAMDLGDEEAIVNSTKAASCKELRGMIARLVLCALVAVMRRSGPNGLAKVAESLQMPTPPKTTGSFGYFAASFTASGVLFALAMLIIAHALPWLNTPITKLFPGQDTWPDTFDNAIKELYAIVPPILISLMVAVFWLVPRERPDARAPAPKAGNSLWTEFVGFFRASAGVLGLCVGVILLFRLGQLFFEFSFPNPDGAERQSVSLLLGLPTIHAFVSITVCLFTTWYLVACNTRQRRAPSFVVTMLAIAGTTALIGLLYELTFIEDYSRIIKPDGSQYCTATGCWEHVLFGILANVLVAVCAFASIALFFTVRERLPEAVGDEPEHASAAPAGIVYRPDAAPSSMPSMSSSLPSLSSTSP